MKWISSNRPNSNVELVVPIKNELLRLPRLLDFYSSFDIVFIDDSHKNVKAVEALQSQYPNVNLKVIHTTEAEHIKF